MSNNGYFHYPDGTDSDTPPLDGQICRVPSHKRGKFTDYEWNEEANEWIILPTHRTPLEVIEKAKEILKIGKYADQRPARSRRSYWDDNYEGMYPYATSSLREVVDIDPLTGIAILDERDPVTCFQSSATRQGPYLPCHCGAMYAETQKEHYEWCPRHPDYERNNRY